MNFGPVLLSHAIGTILGHNVTGENGRRLLRKGRVLSAEDIQLLTKIGRTHIYVAQLDPNDIDENAAALLITQAICGNGLRLSKATTGRVNIFAESLGVFRVAAPGVNSVNSEEAITLATMPDNATARKGKMVATLKIIPYALPKTVAQQCADLGKLLELTPLLPRSVQMILCGSTNSRERIVRSFDDALRPRIETLGSTLDGVHFVPLDDVADEVALGELLIEQSSADLIILAGETAIMDRHDIAPRAIERVGGTITCFGAPVDPGNLLVLADLNDTPILGAPGCARSPKRNIVDLVLPRLLAGDRLTRTDINAYALGGLLEDIPERPLPRTRVQ